jgi:DNA-binding transcriptional MocR family regulator
MMWTPDILSVKGPRYLALAAAIASAIDRGELSPNDQLPPQRDLAERLGVTVGTVGKAYALAKSRKLVSGQVGRGTFVCGPLQSGDADIAEQAARPPVMDLICYRSAAQGATEMIARTLLQLGERAALLPLQNYPPESGYLTHRTAGAAWIARAGLSIPPQQVLLTSGAHQAVAVALAAFCKHGDTVMTETFTYSGLHAIAETYGLKLLGIAMDEEGIVPDALEAACRKSGARVVYLQPTVHNPTTATMSADRRRKIARIIDKHDLLLIEDDAAASALTERPPPIAALTLDRALYVTSVAKGISPSLRLGFIGTGQRLYRHLVPTFYTTSIAVSPLIAELVALMIANGSAETIARDSLKEIGARHDLMTDLLQGFDFAARPESAFLWLKLPHGRNPTQLADTARQSGVYIAQSDFFAADPDSREHAVRIGLTGCPNRQVLTEATRIVTGILRSNAVRQQSVI